MPENTFNILTRGLDDFADAINLTDVLNVINSALNGDLVFVVTPSTVAAEPTAAAWTRDVQIELQNAAGDVQKWFTQDIATGVSIGDTSSAGTATIVNTTLSFTNGVATEVVSGDAEAWLGGTAQVETITCTAAASGDGDITMTITAAGMTNTPKPVVIAVTSAVETTVTLVGDAVRAALALDADVAAFFTISGAAGAVVMTAITPAANDGTMAFGFVDTDTTSVAFGASTNTTAGVAKETDTLTVAEATILGYTVVAATSIETFED